MTISILGSLTKRKGYCQALAIRRTLSPVAEIVNQERGGVLYPDPKRGPWYIVGHWIEIDGRPECIGLELWKHAKPDAARTHVEPLPGQNLQGIGSRDLRMQTAAILAELWEHQAGREQRQRHGVSNALERRRAKLLAEGADPATDKAVEALTTLLDDGDKFTSRSRRRYASDDVDHFRQVAEVYRAALDDRGNPTQAVKDHFRVSESTAAKWVSHARNQLELLPPTRPGVAKGVEPAPKKRRR